MGFYSSCLYDMQCFIQGYWGEGYIVQCINLCECQNLGGFWVGFFWGEGIYPILTGLEFLDYLLIDLGCTNSEVLVSGHTRVSTVSTCRRTRHSTCCLKSWRLLSRNRARLESSDPRFLLSIGTYNRLILWTILWQIADISHWTVFLIQSPFVRWSLTTIVE